MAFEELGKPRYTINESARGIAISIPSKKNWFMIFFLGFWLIGWAVGEISVIGILGTGLFIFFSSGLPDATTTGTGDFGGLFLVAWLGGWTVGGAFTIYAWLWRVKGVEEISISYDSFKIDKKTPVWTRSKEYRLNDVLSLRVSNSQPSMWNMSGGMDFWGFPGGN